jgi:glycolate oxidase
LEKRNQSRKVAAQSAKISPSIIRAFQRIVGAREVFASIEDRICYSFDATTFSSIPGVVVRPSNSEQVSRIVSLAATEGIPVVPRGAGTGFAGSSVPPEGSVALSFERMNRLLSLTPDDLLCSVEPGVVNGALQKLLAQRGLFFPPDPSSLDVCTIGGNVAQCASGPRALKFGSTKDYVVSLEVVSSNGRVWFVSEKTKGYDLLSLLVGSEGTLGVFTAVGLRVVPLPESWTTFMVYFTNLEDASRAVIELSSQGVLPSVLEVMDDVTLRCVEEYLGRRSHAGAGAVLFVEVTGSEAELKALSEKIVVTFNKLKKLSLEFATSQSERDRLWTLRRSVSPALSRVAPTKINEDVCVPRSRLPELVTGIEALASRYALKIYTFGHIGDGNLHVNIMTDARNKEEMERVYACADSLFEVTLSLGGTTSGEHGIGIAKSKYLPDERGPVGMGVLRKIKHVFDPAGILNPGKVIASPS